MQKAAEAVVASQPRKHRLVGPRVGFRQGADPGAVRTRIDRELASAFPNVESRSRAAVEADNRQQLNQVLVLIYALLALSILIAIFRSREHASSRSPTR